MHDFVNFVSIFRLFRKYFLQYDPVSSGTSVAVQVSKIVGEDYKIPNMWM